MVERDPILPQVVVETVCGKQKSENLIDHKTAQLVVENTQVVVEKSTKHHNLW